MSHLWLLQHQHFKKERSSKKFCETNGGQIKILRFPTGMHKTLKNVMPDLFFFTAQGYVQLDELYSLTSCSSTSSPSKSSRSVSSSPTSTLRTRARASSADESANKKINKTGNKESIEDWEISAPEILCNKKNIGKSFSRSFKAAWRRSVGQKFGILGLTFLGCAQLPAKGLSG